MAASAQGRVWFQCMGWYSSRGGLQVPSAAIAQCWACWGPAWFSLGAGPFEKKCEWCFWKTVVWCGCWMSCGAMQARVPQAGQCL